MTTNRDNMSSYKLASFSSIALGSLYYHKNLSCLDIEGQETIRRMHRESIFQQDPVLGYVEISTSCDRFFLQPKVLQAIEYDKDVICNTYNSSIWLLMEKFDGKHPTTQWTHLFTWGFNLDVNNRFVMDFIYASQDPEVYTGDIIVQFSYETVSNDFHVKKNRCTMKGDYWIDFMQQEMPFIGAYITGMLDVEVKQNPHRTDENESITKISGDVTKRYMPCFKIENCR